MYPGKRQVIRGNAMDIGFFFLIIGTIILVGFAGRFLRRRTSVPESLFLILLGLILGPITGIVPGEELLEYVPVVSAAAMVAILVESGVEFNISKLRGSLKKAILFTFIIALLTIALVTLFLVYFFEWELLHAALLGLISSGSTTITAMSLLKGIEITDEIRRLILLETIMNDFTLILGTYTCFMVLMETIFIVII